MFMPEYYHPGRLFPANKLTAMPMFAVTGLLFDCDGVLVDSLDAAAVAWNEWGTRWQPGFDFHRDVEHGRRLADFVTELVGPENAPEAIAELTALERDHAVDVHEIPGAAALLANLPAGRWAVVTSGTRDIATARLTAAGIPTPAVLVTADDVAAGKPSPDPFLVGSATNSTCRRTIVRFSRMRRPVSPPRNAQACARSSGWAPISRYPGSAPPSPTCGALASTAPGCSSANPTQPHKTRRKANGNNISRHTRAKTQVPLACRASQVGHRAGTSQMRSHDCVT